MTEQGGITCKFAWNRMAAQNLEIAIDSALPTFRHNKKDEKYRSKVLIHSYHVCRPSPVLTFLLRPLLLLLQLAAYFGLKDRTAKIVAAQTENRAPPQYLVEVHQISISCFSFRFFRNNLRNAEQKNPV
jgi:hypothetical protein